MRDRLKVFDNFIIPTNFFGPGSVGAYVSPADQQQIEDRDQVAFFVEPPNTTTNKRVGQVYKLGMKRPLTARVKDKITRETFKNELDYFFEKEMDNVNKKR